MSGIGVRKNQSSDTRLLNMPMMRELTVMRFMNIHRPLVIQQMGTFRFPLPD